VKGASSCAMCERLVINAGIEKIFVRDSKENYRMIDVAEWIENDETVEGKTRY